MSEAEQRGLQRATDIEQQWPEIEKLLQRLPPDVQQILLAKYQEKQLENIADLMHALGESGVAKQDLDVFHEHLRKLDHDRKIYTTDGTFKSGSGQINIKVRGGDTSFIVPILVVIGVILLALIALFALR